MLGKFQYQFCMDSIKGSGRKVANQVELVFDNGRLFQSYGCNVAARIDGKLYVDEYYHGYSNTTMAYCKQFTGLTVDQRRKGIENGTIKTFEE